MHLHLLAPLQISAYSGNFAIYMASLFSFILKAWQKISEIYTPQCFCRHFSLKTKSSVRFMGSQCWQSPQPNDPLSLRGEHSIIVGQSYFGCISWTWILTDPLGVEGFWFIASLCLSSYGSGTYEFSNGRSHEVNSWYRRVEQWTTTTTKIGLDWESPGRS